MLSSTDWRAEFRQVPASGAKANARTFTYDIDATGERAVVSLARKTTGVASVLARRDLATRSAADREAFMKARMERPGFTLSRVEVANATEAAAPLVVTAKGTQALERTSVLTLDPFPGMDAGLYLPETLPEQRLDPILMPYLGSQEAVSVIRVPKGYRLPEPVLAGCSNRWGSVVLKASQDPASGDVRVEMKDAIDSAMDLADGYEDFREFLKGVRSAVYPLIILERQD